jgi:hypothetical protein
MTNDKQSNISNHNEKQFLSIIDKSPLEGGIHANASKGHGKTRLLFSMANRLRLREDCRVFIFDGSEAWLYGFDKIPTLTIGEHDITLASKVNTTQDIETYSLRNWNLTRLALKRHKDLLFRLKTRKPSKRGFFVRTVVNYLDTLQRAERTTTKTHEPKKYIAYFVEEAQDAFNSRSTTRLESEEFLTVFNEARNQKEAFFTASQRLNDFSKTIRTKQLYAIGKVNFEDSNAFLRRIEKANNIDFSAIPKRTWFFEGETFVSPQWSQNGKPYQINRKLRAEFSKPKQKRGIVDTILGALSFQRLFKQDTTQSKTETQEDQQENLGLEDSEFDGVMSEGDYLFPSEFPEDSEEE